MGGAGSGLRGNGVASLSNEVRVVSAQDLKEFVVASPLSPLMEVPLLVFRYT